MSETSTHRRFAGPEPGEVRKQNKNMGEGSFRSDDDSSNSSNAGLAFELLYRSRTCVIVCNMFCCPRVSLLALSCFELSWG